MYSFWLPLGLQIMLYKDNTLKLREVWFGAIRQIQSIDLKPGFTVKAQSWHVGVLIIQDVGEPHKAEFVGTADLNTLSC
jgi:hypothetical protein